jgi:hypothetical protein
MAVINASTLSVMSHTSDAIAAAYLGPDEQIRQPDIGTKLSHSAYEPAEEHKWREEALAVMI